MRELRGRGKKGRDGGRKRMEGKGEVGEDPLDLLRQEKVP